MYRFRSGKFQIRFADTAEPDLLLLAGQLINCFKSAEKRGLSLAQLESELSVSRRMHDAKTADGLVKLLCDRTEFSRVQDQDLPQLRKKVFSAVPGLLAAAGLIFVFDYFISFRRVEQAKRRRLALAMAILTAPYTFLVPTNWISG